jgi:predicted nucleotidyltransferase component of viral defense system
MLDLKAISQYYPEQLRPFKDFLLREYLQHKILEVVYGSKFANKLVFIGGTCLRILHNNQRFSEDLDFDNFGCTEADWVQLSDLILTSLEEEGYLVEMKVLHKNAWHCYIRFPGILFAEGLSGYKEQKILIQLDVEPQGYDFVPERKLLNKFDVFTEVICAPLSLLMSHKCYAVLNRPRNKGRDFFDLVFLMGLGVQPDMEFLKAKLGIKSHAVLKKKMLDHVSGLNMKDMAKDVAPFLFHEKDLIKVERFADIVADYWNEA